LEKRCKERRKSKKLHKYIYKYQLSWETERTDLRVTEYHYPSFDRGEETSKTKFTPKGNTKTM
jgi:hypothetical protein